jgi:hypothetical protein
MFFAETGLVFIWKNIYFNIVDGGGDHECESSFFFFFFFFQFQNCTHYLFHRSRASSISSIRRSIPSLSRARLSTSRFFIASALRKSGDGSTRGDPGADPASMRGDPDGLFEFIFFFCFLWCELEMCLKFDTKLPPPKIKSHTWSPGCRCRCPGRTAAARAALRRAQLRARAAAAARGRHRRI